MLWKAKLIVLFMWLLASIAGAVLVMRMKPTYRAQTLILVESQKIPAKYVASTVSGEVQDRLATISQEILSTTRLTKIIDDFKLYSDERKKHPLEDVVDLMRHDIDVKLEKGWTNNRPGAFRISYEGPEANVVAAVTNRLAGLYIDENLKVREVEAEGTSQFLDAQLQAAKKTLDDLEASVSRYKLEHNGELPQQESMITTALARLHTELQGSQDAIDRAQQNTVMYDSELASIQSRLSFLLAQPAPSGAGAASVPTSSSTDHPRPVRQSQLLAEQLRVLRARYSDEYPEVRRVKAEFEATLEAERQQSPSPAAPAKTTTATTPSSESGGNGVRVSPETAREIDQLQQRVRSLQAARAAAAHDIESSAAQREKALKEMSAYQDHLKRLPLREQEMVALTRDYEISKANYRSLLDKKTSADMATELERRQKAERFIILDPAQVPEKPFKPKRGLLISAAAIAGLVLGTVLGMAREVNKGVIVGEWELPSDVRVLGRIPAIDLNHASKQAPASRRRKRAKSGALAATSSLLLGIACAIGCMSSGAL
jgi:polysaccharide chain length determinant protein (PEP-CTERM system associated)